MFAKISSLPNPLIWILFCCVVLPICVYTFVLPSFCNKILINSFCSFNSCFNAWTSLYVKANLSICVSFICVWFMCVWFICFSFIALFNFLHVYVIYLLFLASFLNKFLALFNVQNYILFIWFFTALLTKIVPKNLFVILDAYFMLIKN